MNELLPRKLHNRKLIIGVETFLMCGHCLANDHDLEKVDRANALGFSVFKYQISHMQLLLSAIHLNWGDRPYEREAPG